MFIYNFKVDGNKLGKIVLGILFACIVVITIFVSYKILTGNKEFKTEDIINPKETYEITPTNYTNVLKTVHDNLDTYLEQKIKFSGFVYRVYDFNKDQFVLGRNMIISSDFQTVVVGFLCSHDDAISFEDNAWVEIEGKITKGDYHGEIPIIKVEKIKRIEKPNDEYVYPPDDAFVETSTIL